MRAFPSILVLLALAAPASTARGDGELILRGNYWRDRNTRVIAPEAVVRKTATTGTTFEASYLLDAITSASASAGVQADQPFTELRSEGGMRLAQSVGPATLSALYRYSTESDYWAHSAGGGVLLDLLQKNLTLGLNYVYTHADVGRRMGTGASTLGYGWANGRSTDAGASNAAQSILETHYVSLVASQVLARWAILSGGLEVSYLDGYQANPYRSALVSGTLTPDKIPEKRVRVAANLGLRITPLSHRGVLDHLTFFLGYRLYDDTWGVLAHTPEVRAYLGLGPTELRLALRGYTQSAASFHRDSYDRAVPCKDGPPPTSTCATSDAKLSAFDAVFFEARFVLELRALFAGPSPWSRWAGRGALGVSAGHYWNDGAADRQFGDAWVGGLDLLLPL